MDSWKTKKALQLPEYPSQEELEAVLKTIETFPLVVFAGEVRHLEDRLADVAMGRAFVLQVVIPHPTHGGPTGAPPRPRRLRLDLVCELATTAMSIFEYNGAAVVAMVGKNCFAIASDRRLGVQLQTVATDFRRVFKIHNKFYIGLSGLATDAQTLFCLVFRHKLYQLRVDTGHASEWLLLHP